MEAKNINVNEPEKDEEKKFTQSEVNEILTRRLERERGKKEKEESNFQKELDNRKAEIEKKESNLECKSFLLNNNLPLGLLEILDTSNFEKFKETVRGIDKVIGIDNRTVVLPLYEGSTDAESERKLAVHKHKPKKIY